MLLDDLQKGYYNPLKAVKPLSIEGSCQLSQCVLRELFKMGFNLFCEPLVSNESVASFRFYKHKNYTNMI